MDENKLKDIVEQAIKPIIDQLNDSDTGLAAINRRLDANSASLMTIEKELKIYGDMYKINGSNIKKMEKRLEIVEEDAGIEAPPEFQLADVA